MRKPRKLEWWEKPGRVVQVLRVVNPRDTKSAAVAPYVVVRGRQKPGKPMSPVVSIRLDRFLRLYRRVGADS